MLTNLPEPLRNLPRWLVANDDKIPVLPSSSRRISGDKEPYLMTFENATGLIQSGLHSRLIYYHGDDEPIVSLDIDNCIDDQGEQQPWIRKFLAENDLGYIEYSTSKTGLRIPCIDQNKTFTKRIYYPDKEHYLKPAAKNSPKIEVIASKSLATYTGLIYAGCKYPAGLSGFDRILSWLEKNYPRPALNISPPPLQQSTDLQPIRDALAFISPDLGHDEWKQIGMALHSWDQIAGFQLWLEWSRQGEKFTHENELTSAWKSFSSNKKTSLGTLFHHAKVGGYQANRKPANVIPLAVKKKTDQMIVGDSGKNELNRKPAEPLINCKILPEPETDINLAAPAVKSINLHQNDTLLNKQFTFVVHDGRNYVVRTRTDELKHNVLEFFRPTDFCALLAHWPKVITGYRKDDSAILKPAGKSWLESRGKNFRANGITFVPDINHDDPSKLNTYYGFGVDPIPCESGDIILWLQHVRDIICNGNEDHYQYVLNWLAHMIQQPDKKPGVAIIMKAGQGTGKGAFMDPLGQIMGSHYLYADNPALMTGRFNSLCQHKLLLFADEAFFGSKAASDRLKAKVTEKYASIEHKGIDPIVTRDYSRVVMAGNKANMVQIDNDDRRYLYLAVSHDRQQDLEYFQPLWEQIDSGQLAPRLLYYLQHRDISDFIPQAVPKTDELMEEKLDHLAPVELWALHILRTGRIEPSMISHWPQTVDSHRMTVLCEDWLLLHSLKVFGYVEHRLGRFLKKLGFLKDRQRVNGTLTHIFHVPPIDTARHKFDQWIHGSISW